MPAGRPSIDTQALHEYLWSLADASGRLRINQQFLADDLGLHRVSVARHFRIFVQEGRIRKIKGGYRRVVMYEVSDPLAWANELKP